MHQKLAIELDWIEFQLKLVVARFPRSCQLRHSPCLHSISVDVAITFYTQ